ncbi:hypothetical protein MKEN_00458100 [Mycena kentingensis (nom. inval.)]|nr:hypothetical protein MKEN_00458100 [Mycena kentingensis (nom. inval.)]
MNWVARRAFSLAAIFPAAAFFASIRMTSSASSALSEDPFSPPRAIQGVPSAAPLRQLGLNRIPELEKLVLRVLELDSDVRVDERLDASSGRVAFPDKSKFAGLKRSNTVLQCCPQTTEAQIYSEPGKYERQVKLIPVSDSKIGPSRASLSPILLSFSSPTISHTKPPSAIANMTNNHNLESGQILEGTADEVVSGSMAVLNRFDVQPERPDQVIENDFVLTFVLTTFSLQDLRRSVILLSKTNIQFFFPVAEFLGTAIVPFEPEGSEPLGITTTEESETTLNHLAKYGHGTRVRLSLDTLSIGELIDLHEAAWRWVIPEAMLKTIAELRLRFREDPFGVFRATYLSGDLVLQRACAKLLLSDPFKNAQSPRMPAAALPDFVSWIQAHVDAVNETPPDYPADECENYYVLTQTCLQRLLMSPNKVLDLDSVFNFHPPPPACCMASLAAWRGRIEMRAAQIPEFRAERAPGEFRNTSSGK